MMGSAGVSPDGPEAVIRAAHADDLPAVVRLLADDPIGSGREAPPAAGEQAAPAYRDAFAAMERQGGNTLLVAERSGELVACLQLTLIPGISRGGALRAQIEGVRVAASERGGGLGARLVAAAIERAREAGAQLVQLTTDCRRPDAQRFYERLGFEPTHVGMKLEL